MGCHRGADVMRTEIASCARVRCRSARVPRLAETTTDQSGLSLVSYQRATPTEERCMVRTFLTLFSIVGASAAVATSALARQAAVPTLRGTVGPGYTITLKQNGA